MQQRKTFRAWRSALATGVAISVGGLAQSAAGEESYGVEVLPVVAAQAEAPPAVPAESPDAAAEPAPDEVVLLIDVEATSLTIERELPPPGVTVRGWDPDTPSQIRVIGSDTGDASRIPVLGWDPDAPQRLRVHSWTAGTP